MLRRARTIFSIHLKSVLGQRNALALEILDISCADAGPLRAMIASGSSAFARVASLWMMPITRNGSPP